MMKGRYLLAFGVYMTIKPAFQGP